MRLAILGAGGHGRDIKSIAEACGHIAVLIDDDMDLGLPGGESLPIFDAWLVGVNDPVARAKAATRWDHPLASVIHPSASVDTSATWGPGVVIAQNATIGPCVALGGHVHVNGGAFLTRATVGDFTTIGPNATVCGDVTIGERCSIGAGAVVSNLAVLADDVTVGAGSVVTPGACLRPGTWVGSPVRRVG